MEELEGSKKVEEVEGTAAEAPPELKVVIQLKGNRALVGIQDKDTDPVLVTLEAGSLEAVLDAVPGLLRQARENWATSPRNPKYEGPPPPPAPTSAPRQATGRASAAPKEETPRMF